MDTGGKTTKATTLPEEEQYQDQVVKGCKHDIMGTKVNATVPSLWSENAPPLPLPLQGGVAMDLPLQGQGVMDQLPAVMRLRQLRAWQMQQQESLLRRQQEQLARLRNDQAGGGGLRKEQAEVVREGSHGNQQAEVRRKMAASGGPPTSPHTDPPMSSTTAVLRAIENIPTTAPHAPSLSVRASSETADARIHPATREMANVHHQHVITHVQAYAEAGTRVPPAIGDNASVGEVCIPDGRDPIHSTSGKQGSFSSSDGRKEEQLHAKRELGQPSEDDRPIRPGVGFESASSFEQLVERQLRQSLSPPAPHPAHPPAKRTFLRKGEGIARFGVKTLGPKPRRRSSGKLERKTIMEPPFPTSGASAQPLRVASTHHPPAMEHALPLVSHAVADRQYLHGNLSRLHGSLSDSNESIPQAPLLVSTPTMRRCSSEDSFLIRKDHRLQLEEEELKEFELLEHAAAMSYSATPSPLLVWSTSPCSTPTAHSVTTSPCDTPPPHSPPPSPPPTSIFHPLTWTQPPYLPMPPTLQTTSSVDPLANGLPLSSGSSLANGCPSSSRESSPDQVTDLDETLKPSAAMEMQFSDEDPWESFAQASPPGHNVLPTPSPSQPPVSALTSPSRGRTPAWASPVKRELLNNHGRAVFTSPLPTPSLTSHTLMVPHPSTGEGGSSQQPVHRPTQEHAPTSTLPPPSANTPTSTLPPPSANTPSTLPPPSALVSKLFPVLRKEREESRRQAVETMVVTSTHSLHSPSSVSDQSSGSSGRATEDSGCGSAGSPPMSDELHRKLCELETEIERFRAENAALGRLREQKDKELAYLKEEVTEFERQKQEEVERFEEYRKEEIKKLKKERKVFESYQREARAARDKRDKEEIDTLRNELQEAREELQRRESRWSATISRYRGKVEGLEARNRELQEDLRTIEQERLQWWQAQVEATKTRSRPSGGPERGERLRSQLSGAQERDDRSRGEIHKPGKRSTVLSVRVPASVLSDEKGGDDATDEESLGMEGSREGESSSPSDQGDCEIVDVVCQDREERREEEEEESGSEGGSDLSAVAEEIVSEVLGKRQSEWERGREIPSTLRDGGRKTAKTVKFSDSPPRIQDSTNPSLSHKLVPPPTTGIETPQSKQKVETVQADGSRVIVFPNGTQKTISRDGRSITVHFFNGDIKRIQPDQIVVYYYADSRTTHTTYPDGLEVLEFPNNQSEKHYPNGTKEISFPDGTTKYVYVTGDEESVFPDGTVQRLLPSGDRTIEFPNGQKEVHTREFKRREYPDGTIKTVYPDGRQETRYASGRLRIKDKTGNVLVDKVEKKKHL